MNPYNLLHDKGNAKIHNEEQIEQIKKKHIPIRI